MGVRTDLASAAIRMSLGALTRAEDVQRVARAYVNPEVLQIVAVGDSARIQSALQKYGPVEIFDAAGAARPAPSP